MMNSQRKPVLVDGSLNKAFTIKYAIYSAFGLSGVFAHIPSIRDFAGDLAAQVTGFAVFLFGLLAAISASKSLNSSRWERWELYSTITLISFVLVYNVALILLALGGSGGRIGLAILATALLVFPCWRIRYILKKNRIK